MKFGVTVAPRVSDWKLFVDLETMGYDCAWAADSQMLYSDAYATLALAAANTSRIRLGTGVSVAGVRLARALDALYHQAKAKVARTTGTTTTSMMAIELINSSRSADAIGPFGSRTPSEQPPSVVTPAKTKTLRACRMLNLVCL